MVVQEGEWVQGCEERLKILTFWDGITGYLLPTYDLSGKLRL
jgi:hypothetical protein